MTETLNGIHLARIPRGKITNSKLIRAQGKGETLEQIYARLPDPKPTYLFNGGLFSFGDGYTVVALKVDGQIIREKSAKNYGFVVCGKGATIHIRTLGDRSFKEISSDYNWAIESAPLLLPTLIRNEFDASLVNGSHLRTAFGFDDQKNEYHLAVTDTKLTCQQLANDLKKLGCDTLLNLDGGGSSKVLYHGKPINNQPEKRPIANAIAIWVDETKMEDKPHKTRIVIDAGHGQDTPGKRTPDGSMREYQFNSVVAEYVKQDLLRYDGVEVLTVHENGRDVPLKERTDKANAFNADIYVSIHANASGEDWNATKGIETYIYKRGSEAEKVAGLVHKELIKNTGRTDRGVKVENFHVLRETKMPAILVECGFMTNQEEASLLKCDDYRRKCAQSIVFGLVTYFSLNKKAEAPQAHGIFKVQIGVFSERESAVKLAEELKQKGYQAIVNEEK